MPIFSFRKKLGQDKSLIRLVELKAGKPESGVWAVLLADSLKGYVFVEGSNIIEVEKTMGEIRTVTGRALGSKEVPMSEIAELVIPKSPIEGLTEGDIIRIIDGPFKDLRAKITRMDTESEITVELLDSNMKLPLKLHADFVRKVSQD